MDNTNTECATTYEYNKTCTLIEETFTPNQKKSFYQLESLVETLSLEQLSLLIKIETIVLESKKEKNT